MRAPFVPTREPVHRATTAWAKLTIGRVEMVTSMGLIGLFEQWLRLRSSEQTWYLSGLRPSIPR